MEQSAKVVIMEIMKMPEMKAKLPLILRFRITAMFTMMVMSAIEILAILLFNSGRATADQNKHKVVV